ncbi:hypothetical protein NDU88_000112 [Pleurodeles waltl]|uniref:Uncharacterized protein n=1 Tax=Pleurodeles waltl TaxID=8319 RepID=A0AAV7KW40_PLEWA|nr:hypothetical protein NDU88_000112 [Pleurodeles waltl]
MRVTRDARTAQTYHALRKRVVVASGLSGQCACVEGEGEPRNPWSACAAWQRGNIALTPFDVARLPAAPIGTAHALCQPPLKMEGLLPGSCATRGSPASRVVLPATPGAAPYCTPPEALLRIIIIRSLNRHLVLHAFHRPLLEKGNTGSTVEGMQIPRWYYSEPEAMSSAKQPFRTLKMLIFLTCFEVLSFLLLMYNPDP